MNLLAELYSYIDGKKRQLRGLLSDPVETINQGLLNFRDDQNNFLNLAENAYPGVFPGSKTVLNTPEQVAGLRKQFGDKATDMAFAGVSAPAKFIYPQDKALEQARKNGVKMLGLPENNTPMDRAKAMGFDVDLYHGRKGDFSAFDKSVSGLSTNTKNVARQSISLTPDASLASDYSFWAVPPDNIKYAYLQKELYKIGKKLNSDPEAGEKYKDLYNQIAKLDYVPGFNINSQIAKNQANVMPIVAKTNNILDVDTNGKWNQTVLRSSISDAKNGGFDGVKFNSVPDVLPAFKSPETYRADIFAITNPAILRSRFAAFDPARINENDLLAGALPFGLLADEETRKKFGF